MKATKTNKIDCKRYLVIFITLTGRHPAPTLVSFLLKFQPFQCKRYDWQILGGRSKNFTNFCRFLSPQKAPPFG